MPCGWHEQCQRNIMEDPETISGWYRNHLSLYHNRHHYWSTTSEKVAILGNLTTQSLYQLPSFNLWIFCEKFFITCSNSFEYFFVYIHHFIGMNKSSRINKNMPCNSASSRIFFESKYQYSIFSKLFSISKSVSRNNSDRKTIYKKCI